MSSSAKSPMRRVLIACTAMSVLGAGSAFVDYGLSRGLLWREAGGGLAREIAQAGTLLAQAASGLAALAAKPADAVTPGVHAVADEPEPHHIFTASMTAIGPQLHDAEAVQQDVNRHRKGDRLAQPELAVAKLSLPAPEPVEEGASAALFMLSPTLAEPGMLAVAPPASPEPATAKPGQPAPPVSAATMAMAVGPLTASPQAAPMQPPVRSPFVASAASSASVPASKISWSDLIRMAGMKAGDGEEPAKIFGALSEKEFRAREVRCMATAIYHEARGESMRGQIAVGQVIMNRVRSNFYPNTICGVVFQGQWNRNACQFSFACDGRTDAPKENELWKTSLDVAKQVISGKAHLPDIADATHYHAVYVRPDWRRDVRRIKQIGVHIFYKAPFVTPLALDPDYQQL